MSSVGSGSNPRTLAQLNAERAAEGGDGDDREWKNGGRIRALIASIPLATLLIMLANMSIGIYQLASDEAAGENLICVGPITEGHQYYRIISNGFFHMNIFHIGFNMMAMYQIGTMVEAKMGTLTVLGQAALFSPFIGLLYILIEYLASNALKDEQYLWQCAIGYSGVVFAFLIVSVGLEMQEGQTTRTFCGCPIPIYLFPIIMLLLLQIFLPGISFVGHLSGIIIGFIYVRGVLLPFTMPRQWLLALQAFLPRFITSRSAFKNVPEVDPFQSWAPSICMDLHRCCPNMPMPRPRIGGGEGEGQGCLAWFKSLFHSPNRVGGGGGNAGGNRVGGRGASRLLQSHPVQSIAMNSLPAVNQPSSLGPMQSASSASSASSSSNNRPPSPSMVSVPARPGSSPIESDNGHAMDSSEPYARLMNDEPGADVSAHLLGNASAPMRSDSNI